MIRIGRTAGNALLRQTTWREPRQGKPDAGAGLELDAIAAVVIGGTSLLGGRGSLAGTFCGVLIFGLLSNILQLHNINSKPPVPPPVMPVSPINEPEPDLLPDEAPNPNQDEHKDPQIRVASFRPSELIFSFFGT